MFLIRLCSKVSRQFALWQTYLAMKRVERNFKIIDALSATIDELKDDNKVAIEYIVAIRGNSK